MPRTPTPHPRRPLSCSQTLAPPYKYPIPSRFPATAALGGFSPAHRKRRGGEGGRRREGEEEVGGEEHRRSPRRGAVPRRQDRPRPRPERPKALREELRPGSAAVVRTSRDRSSASQGPRRPAQLPLPRTSPRRSPASSRTDTAPVLLPLFCRTFFTAPSSRPGAQGAAGAGELSSEIDYTDDYSHADFGCAGYESDYGNNADGWYD